MKSGCFVSSKFVVLQPCDGGEKGRLVVNLSDQSNHWPKGSMKIEHVGEFVCHLLRGDHPMSMDIYKGYRLLRLHPSMRNWSLFQFNGRYYWCVALPFSWGRSPLWVTQVIAIFTRMLREQGYRVLAYLDDFLFASSPHGQRSTHADCAAAMKHVDTLMRSLGIRRHPSKGCLKVVTSLDHLDIHIDTEAMRFTVTDTKRKRVEGQANKHLQSMRLGRWWVGRDVVASFCGLCVSLTLAMRWSRFYTQSLYCDLSRTTKRIGRKLLFRLSHQSV